MKIDTNRVVSPKWRDQEHFEKTIQRAIEGNIHAKLDLIMHNQRVILAEVRKDRKVAPAIKVRENLV